MGPLDAYVAVQSALGAEKHAARMLDARRAFERRTGAFGAEDEWFEARSRAFWDDAITSRDACALAAPDVPDEARAWLAPLARAHRGLFVSAAARAGQDGATLVRDLVSGAELFVDEMDAATRDAVSATESVAPFDGRVVAGGSPARTALLPGAVFHPEDAAEPIDKVLAAARARGMTRDALLDALLRMELSLRRLSRVKASYAYRL